MQAIFMLMELSCYYGSFQYLNMTDAVVLSEMAPILVGFYGWLFYNAEYNLKDIFLALVAFTGVVFIA